MQQTNPNYLQKQYTKLTQNLQKAYQSGKFYQYTQYKQSQLLDKLASYTLQLKKLGMAAAVVTGVGMATPAVGQVTPILFMENTGTANPLNSADDTLNRCSITFADLDADGDLDVVGFYFNYFTNENVYYENIGAADSAVYTRRSRLLPSANIEYPSFVDVDGDGDLDCFAGTIDPYYSIGESVSYFENTGDSINPSFTQRTGTANPLDTINSMYPQMSNDSKSNKGSTFIDIDMDDDLDLLYYISIPGGAAYHFFRNNGSTTSPNFDLDQANNPFQDTIPGGAIFRGKIQFVDADNDNDLDILLDDYYYENEGSAANPLYTTRLTYSNPANPFRNLNNTGISSDVQLQDIDNDGDLDLFGHSRELRSAIYADRKDTIRYFENLTITALPRIEQQQKINLTISPNPTTGYIQLDRPITGSMEVFNTAGQVVQSAQLNEEQAIDLGDLTNGIYFLKVQTLEGLINEKIVLSK